GFETGYFHFAGKAKSEDEKHSIFSTAWSTVALVALFFLALVLGFCGPIAGVMGYANNPSYVAVVAGIVALDVITAIPFARVREQGKALKYVTIRTLSVVINIVFTVFFFSALPYLTESLGGFWMSIYRPESITGYVFVANLIASFAVLLMLFPSNLKLLGRGIDRKQLGVIAMYSLPLLISGIAGTANEFIDRQMIKYVMPASESMAALGIYGAVVKIGVILLLFTQMYRLAAEPYFLSGFSKKDFVRTNAEALKYFIVASVFIFLMITLFTDIFALIVGADFREGMYILPVVLLSNMLSGVVFNLSFWYKQAAKTKFAMYVTITGLVFTVLLNFALIPVLGYFGAALARLGCEIAMVALSYYLNRRHYPTPYDLPRIGLYLLGGAVIYGASMLFVEPNFGILPKNLINLGLLGLFATFVVRRENINVVEMFKSIIKTRL
ncbi:MAG: polysaccharide biosynthesis C-terminal domain-containing protein, partial [Rikenellaceae bacterium]